jgi:hypothetical protein
MSGPDHQRESVGLRPESRILCLAILEIGADATARNAAQWAAAIGSRPALRADLLRLAFAPPVYLVKETPLQEDAQRWALIGARSLAQAVLVRSTATGAEIEEAAALALRIAAGEARHG